MQEDQVIADPLGSLQIIDSDADFTEPPDLWSARVPASQRDRVPVMRTENGISAWFLDDEPWAPLGGNTIASGVKKVLGLNTVQPFEAVDPSAYDVDARLALMDVLGIQAQVLYPNAVGFASNSVFAIEDTSRRSDVQRIYNDFLVDVQQRSGDRLLPQAVLPIWDMDETVTEMARLHEAGIRGFTVTDKPQLVGLPDLDHPYFAPMWTLADETRTVMNFHIGSGGMRASMNTDDAAVSSARRAGSPVAGANPSFYWESFGPQRRLAALSTQFYMSNVRVVVNFCLSGIFDRYPHLKISSAESGIGWIPFVLEAMEYQLDEMVTSAEEKAIQTRRPTEYFRDHFFVSFWFEHIGPAKLIQDIGEDNVFVETDIPHPTCIYPGTRERLASAVAGLTDDVRAKVLRENAARVDRLNGAD